MQINFNTVFTNKGKARDCVLVLTGTSTQVEDISHFLFFLEQKGYPVATLERFIGGPLDIRYNPKRDRHQTLESALTSLIETHAVRNIQVVAHSYAANEIIRWLSENPARYSGHISNIILVNPTGFCRKPGRFFRHCLRFIFLLILKEYCFVARELMSHPACGSVSKAFLRSKLQATNSLLLKTFRNPSKTFKEVADIVSFQAKPYLTELIQEHHYRFQVFLNEDDTLVAANDTMAQLRDLLPPRSLLICPGNHMDLFLDTELMHRFNTILTEHMERTC